MSRLDDLLESAAPIPSRDVDVGAIAGRALRRTRGRRVALGGAAVIAAVLLLVGVGRLIDDSGRSAGLQTVDEPTSADPLAGVSEESWVRLLARVPNNVDTAGHEVVMDDLARARRQAGIGPLADSVSDTELDDHLRNLFGTPEPGLWYGGYEISSDELEAELGFRLEQLDQVVSHAGTPPSDIYLATGRFDPQTIEAAALADPLRSDQLTASERDGVAVYRWGEDYQGFSSDPDRTPTPVRGLGRGGRLVVGDGWLSWTLGDAEMEATIEAALDPTRSMAVVDWAKTLGLGADAAELTSFSILPVDWYGLVDQYETNPSTTDDLPTLDPPISFGLGSRWTGTGYVTAVMLVYPTEADAAASRSALEESLPIVYPTRTTQVTRDGTLLTISAEVEAIDDLGWWLTGRAPDRSIRFQPAGEITLPRPQLPDEIPTQAEVLADGVVTDEEYEVAFWSWVACVEGVGGQVSGIRRDSDGRLTATVSGTLSFDPTIPDNMWEVNECGEALFDDISIRWQMDNLLR